VQFGRYVVTGKVGEGAAGTVYRALDGDGAVAIKVLRHADATAERRFAREARLAAATRSRHLVPVLDQGPGFFVMPLYDGGSVADRVRRDGPLPPEALVDLAAQVAAGIDALHEVGVVHRDIKPSNVLLARDGTAALADFGLARRPDSTKLTAEGQLVGTSDYLAPEVIAGSDATPASDIYSFGCLLYECAAGTPPFGGRSELQTGYAHLAEPPPDPRVHRPDLPADVALSLLTALEKAPEKRPTTASALARMLHLAGTAAPGGRAGG
jgi:serine/threonine protein kinase